MPIVTFGMPVLLVVMTENLRGLGCFWNVPHSLSVVPKRFYRGLLELPIDFLAPGSPF
jgi:hypothetical protein